MKSVVDQNGDGIYRLNQEVQVKTDEATHIIKETWTIVDGHTLQLTARGGTHPEDTWEMHVLYTHPNRVTLEPNGQLKSYPWSEEFIEPFFHYRSTTDLLGYLVRTGFLPRTALQSERPVSNLNNLDHSPEPYVELSRVGGSIAYAFYQPQSQVQPPPTFWVEQDAFHVRRIRFKSQADVLADGHQIFARKLTLPKTRSVSWGDHTVTIRTLSAQALPASAKSQLTRTELAKAAGQVAPDRRIPPHPLIREFYSRFR